MGSGEPRGLLFTLGGILILALRKSLKRKAASDREFITRAEFDAQVLALSERINANHLAILEKLEAHQRAILVAIEGLAAKISDLSCTVARLDERTKK